VSASIGSLLGQLVAPASVVAVSPLSIIVAVLLVVHTDRPRSNGLAFLVGRLVALAVVTAVFVAAPRLLGDPDRPVPPRVLLVAGAVCLAFGAWFWLRRGRMTEEPRWLRRLSAITPLTAGVIGVVLVVSNPKMLAASAAAGLLVGTGQLGALGLIVAVTFYAVVASSTVAGPVLAYVAVGVRAEQPLTRLRIWLHRHSGAVSAAILVAVGAALLVAGARGS